MIEVNQLKKIYLIKEKEKGAFFKKSHYREAVKKISLSINKGQIVGLLGVNGAGKTTTIKMLSTLLTPDGGYAKIDGYDLLKDRKKIRSLINMIAGGERMIYLRLTPKENLEYFGRLYNIDRHLLDKTIKELLSFVGLEKNANQPVETFSKGMKQRLQIARGLINNPNYLFLDEPTIGLDVSIAKQIRSYLMELTQEKQKGILLTSHYMNEVEELCDYLYVINEGENLIEGKPKQVINELSGFREKLIVDVNNIENELEKNLDELAIRSCSNIKIEKDKKRIICITNKKNFQSELIHVIGNSTVINKLITETPSLEDVMVKLMEGK